MGTVRFLFILLCVAFTGRGFCAGRSDVVGVTARGESASSYYLRLVYRPKLQELGKEKLLAVAISQLGVREATGNNDGRQVEKYLAYVGFKKGNPWCASYVSWCFGQVGYGAPRTAWSPALFPPNRLVTEPSPAMVFGIYFESLKRIGHCGIVEKMQGDVCITLEGNTNSEGGREGNGVFRRLRHRRTIKAFADWLRG